MNLEQNIESNSGKFDLENALEKLNSSIYTKSSPKYRSKYKDTHKSIKYQAKHDYASMIQENEVEIKNLKEKLQNPQLSSQQKKEIQNLILSKSKFNDTLKIKEKNLGDSLAFKKSQHKPHNFNEVKNIYDRLKEFLKELQVDSSFLNPHQDIFDKFPVSLLNPTRKLSPENKNTLKKYKAWLNLFVKNLQDGKKDFKNSSEPYSMSIYSECELLVAESNKLLNTIRSVL